MEAESRKPQVPQEESMMQLNSPDCNPKDQVEDMTSRPRNATAVDDDENDADGITSHLTSSLVSCSSQEVNSFPLRVGCHEIQLPFALRRSQSIQDLYKKISTEIEHDYATDPTIQREIQKAHETFETRIKKFKVTSSNDLDLDHIEERLKEVKVMGHRAETRAAVRDISQNMKEYIKVNLM